MNEELYNLKKKELEDHIANDLRLAKHFKNINGKIIAQLVVVIAAIFMGGAVIGAIAAAMSKWMLVSLLVSAAAVITQIPALYQNYDSMQVYKGSAKTYSDDLKILKDEHTKAYGRSIVKESGNKPSKGNNKKYSYDKSNKDIPLEFFSESDFDDELDKSEHKSR